MLLGDDGSTDPQCRDLVALNTGAYMTTLALTTVFSLAHKPAPREADAVHDSREMWATKASPTFSVLIICD
jgi:hypothetical protein